MKRLYLEHMKMNQRERVRIADAINWFGDGSHPWARPETAHQYGASYAAGCLRVASRKVMTVTSAEYQYLYHRVKCYIRSEERREDR